jgi:hypothetical protein
MRMKRAADSQRVELVRRRPQERAAPAQASCRGRACASRTLQLAPSRRPSSTRSPAEHKNPTGPSMEAIGTSEFSHHRDWVQRLRSPWALRGDLTEFVRAIRHLNPAHRFAISADAGLDQRYKLVDRGWRHHTGAGIECNAWHQIFLRQHALQYWYEAL